MTRRCILLVEDDEDDIVMVTKALAKGDLDGSLRIARSGEEAIRLLHEGELEPDEVVQLVMLDLGLPGRTGFEVLAAIRAHPLTRTLPVVVLTGSSAPEDVKQAYEAGANSYIEKPVGYERFRTVLIQTALYWIGINRPTADESS